MKVTWTVTPVGYQHMAKRCPSCNVKRDFAPSGAIRVNSQKKLLDVWSIYRCTHCDYTWNLSLFSRLPVSKIDRQLHYRLMINDAATVQHFASDIAILKRNNAELSGRPDFCVQEHWLPDITARQQVYVVIRISHSFQVSLLSILQKQLMQSTGEIRRRVDAGQISGVTMKMLKSRKLKAEEYKLVLSLETLYSRRNDRSDESLKNIRGLFAGLRTDATEMTALTENYLPGSCHPSFPDNSYLISMCS